MITSSLDRVHPETSAGESAAPRSLWRRVRSLWCHYAHGSHHRKTPRGEAAWKITCDCCGRRFIRERHRGYSVG